MLGNTFSKFESVSTQRCLTLRVLPMLIVAALAQSARAADPAAADPAAVDPAAANPAVSFDPSFFATGQASRIDLSRFEKDNTVVPGTYSTDIYVNRVWMERSDVVFSDMPGTKQAQPCYTHAALTRYGIDIKKVAAATDQAHKPLPEDKFCGNLADYVPGATVSFDGSTQTLTLEVPQIYMLRNARGYVDPSQWDAGINAAVIGYNANVYHTDSAFGQTSGYLGLNISQNLGSWHIAHLGALSWTNRTGFKYQPSATYLQHDFPSLKAQMVVGDSFTPGDLFDSVRLRGVRLYTDDRMYPYSQRGFAPTVYGVADTNAHVVIRQRGYVIYDTTVAPGPFSIDDLNPTGYGGDLDVEVIEADGRVKRFTVPYSAVPQLLRPGQSRWSLAAGKVEQLNLVSQPTILQGTYQLGLSNRWTAYAGATAGTGYGALLAGAALNTPIGAFAADITEARNRAPSQSATHGASLRVGYNKNIIGTGTNIGMAAYRYSTGGYVSLNDAAAMRDAQARGYDMNLVPKQRNRLSVNVSQNLGSNRGQLYLNGSLLNYWNNYSRQLSFSAGYSNRLGPASYSISAQRTRTSTLNHAGYVNPIANRIPGDIDATVDGPTLIGRTDTSIMFTVTLPLGKSANAPMFSAFVNHGNNTGDNTQVNVAGTYGTDRRFSYGMNLGHTDGGTAESINGQYNGSHGNLAASYGNGSGYSQLSGGMSGSLLLHAGGFTFTPPTGDTIGLIHAPDAEGARIQPGQGSVVDGNGYAVVPYLIPYQRNTVTIDPKSANANLDLESTEEHVAPRAGSVVLVNFKTSSGRAVSIDSGLSNGRPIPFGADVLDAKGNNIGVVGQASQVYIRDMQSSGTVTVRWGEGADNNCQIDVQLPAVTKKSKETIESIHAACRMQDAAVSRTYSSLSEKPMALFDAMQRNAGVESVLALPKFRNASIGLPIGLDKSKAGLPVRTQT